MPGDWLANGGDVTSQAFMTGVMANEWSRNIGWLFYDLLTSYPEKGTIYDTSITEI